uniref:Uncharacterized protein n=1 Tax=Rhizophora mucronata TaxID=61149 RepID=A0A2P2QBC4_RHIMU
MNLIFVSGFRYITGPSLTGEGELNC